MIYDPLPASSSSDRSIYLKQDGESIIMARSCRVLMQGCILSRRWKNEGALTNLPNLKFKISERKKGFTMRAQHNYTYPITMNKTLACRERLSFVASRCCVFLNCQLWMRTCNILCKWCDRCTKVELYANSSDPVCRQPMGMQAVIHPLIQVRANETPYFPMEPFFTTLVLQ